MISQRVDAVKVFEQGGAPRDPFGFEGFQETTSLRISSSSVLI